MLFGPPTSTSRQALYERLGLAALIQPLNLTTHYTLDLSFQLDYIAARMLLAAYLSEIASGHCDPTTRTDFGGPLQQCWRNVELDGSRLPCVDPATFHVRPPPCPQRRSATSAERCLPSSASAWAAVPAQTPLERSTQTCSVTRGLLSRVRHADVQ